MTTPPTHRAALIILDGFGIAPNGPYNAVRNAKMPYYHDLVAKNPTGQLICHGEAVGLPEGIMGNSEVGHMTLGAGRIIYQDLTRINLTIRNQTFFKNETICRTIDTGKNKTGRVHFWGLLSDGGVHSTIQHLLSLIDLCVERNVPEVSVHVFLDGRDTPPHSGVDYVKRLLSHPAFGSNGKNGTKARIATVMGRYWAMDRDKRWERLARAYAAMTGQIEETRMNAVEAIEASYKAEKTDEFVDPILLSKDAAIREGDSAFFFNFRSDRAREISEAFVAEEFPHFDRGNNPKLSAYAGMTVYDKNLPMPAAFPPQSLDNIFGAWLEKHHLTQLRIAETEKYAHVTFFFNGGREKPFEGEDRILIPSPKEVPTYDLKPEMSACPVCDAAIEKIKASKPDFMLLNFANPDMVGHTGNYDAVMKALETIDQCLSELVPTLTENGYQILLTADHGNAEQLRDETGGLHTQHTLNPVPCTWITPNDGPNNYNVPKGVKRELRSGGLSDIMPTLCELMSLELPKEVTGKSLLAKK